MKRIFIVTSLMFSTYCAAHDPVDATAKLLDDYLEIAIHHPTDDPQHHYVNHVKVKKGSSTIFNKKFTAQTDIYSLDVQIPHPTSHRKRLKKGALIRVKATCNQGGTLNKEIRVQ